MSEFFINGPYNIPVSKKPAGRMIKSDLTIFWDEVDGVAQKRGVYVFAIKTGRGYTPIYVGKATKGFKQECFAHHKLAAHYNPCLLEYRRGKPVMFFVCQSAGKGKPNHKETRQLENFLIQVGLTRNPELSNVRGTKQEEWSIAGVLRSGQGKPTYDACEFKKMMSM